MIRVNLADASVLDILMSRVAEAQSKFKRCCIAFADMCCAKSRTAAGCCESSCDGTSEKSPLLQKVSTSESAHENRRDQKTEVDLVATLPATQTEVKDDIVLEVIGMDCPDCLSKVTRAVQILSGAEVTNADGVRGLVGVRYDPSEQTSSQYVSNCSPFGQIVSTSKRFKRSRREHRVSPSTCWMLLPRTPGRYYSSH